MSGFSNRMRKAVDRIKPGDVLLCYLTGVMRWVGALEVTGRSTDQRRIWKDAEFPARLSVKPLVTLSPEHAVPMGELYGKVAFFAGPSDIRKLGLASSLKPDFLAKTAEYFTEDLE